MSNFDDFIKQFFGLSAIDVIADDLKIKMYKAIELDEYMQLHNLGYAIQFNQNQGENIFN